MENVSNTFQPALFIHAINDELINVEHSINLFNNYGGPKSLKCCDKGGHNSRRPKIIKKEIGDFFYKYLYTYDHESEQKESNIVHNYKIINSIENEVNSIDNYEDNQDIEYEYEYENYINEDEDLNNIYEEDYIVNQIIQSQNGGKIEKKENNIGLNENEKMNKERIQKKIKEKNCNLNK